MANIVELREITNLVDSLGYRQLVAAKQNVQGKRPRKFFLSVWIRVTEEKEGSIPIVRVS